jgi:hypothetical protein
MQNLLATDLGTSSLPARQTGCGGNAHCWINRQPLSGEPMATPIPLIQEATMKALVYEGPRKVTVKEMPDAKIQRPTDVLVKIRTTNICGFERACMLVKAEG